MKHVLLCARKVPKTNAKAIGIIIAVVDARHALEEEVQETAKVVANLGKWHPESHKPSATQRFFSAFRGNK